MNYKKIIHKQATINIGTIGHVAHGKSTLVRQISSVTTTKYKSELERNITIKLGYANAKIFACRSCPRPIKYKSFQSSIEELILPCKNKKCTDMMDLVRHISFVDCPGHDILMATMLTGTCIMDAAILLIAANEKCPQPQTQEHLFAVEIMDLNKIIIVQNKCDLVAKEKSIENKEQIEEFAGKNYPVVPASCQLGYNVDAILDYIVNYIPEPERIQNMHGLVYDNDEEIVIEKDSEELEEEEEKKLQEASKLEAANKLAERAQVIDKEDGNNAIDDENIFEENLFFRKSGKKSKKKKSKSKNSQKNKKKKKKKGLTDSQRLEKNLKKLSENLQALEIINNRSDPLMTVIRSFDVNKPGCEIEELKGGIIGGSLIKGIVKIGDLIEIRPGLVTKTPDGDSIVKPILTTVVSLMAETNNLLFSLPGGLVGIGTFLDPYYCRQDKLVGQIVGLRGKLPPIFHEVQIEHSLFKKIAGASVKDSKICPIKIKENLLLNIGATSTGCIVDNIENNILKLSLLKPACCDLGERCSISRKISNSWRLIGYGKLVGGIETVPVYDE